MTNKSNCGCSSTEFNAEEAFVRLSRSHNLLMETVSQYMNEAPITRAQRNKNAEFMAAELERIVGGKKVDPGEFPECCLIGNIYPNGYPKRWYCTGTLIHPRVVVTAEHCMPSKPNAVALGVENQNDIIPNSENVLKVLKRLSHPSEDISLLLLHRSSDISPVEVATSEELSASEEVKLVGFGNNDLNGTRGFGIKRKVNVGITGLRRDSGEDLSNLERKFGFNSFTEFVAGRKGLEMDSCNGDSGGPAYIYLDNKRKVCGATSRATDEWEQMGQPCGHGGVYVRLDKHMEWINQSISNWGL